MMLVSALALGMLTAQGGDVAGSFRHGQWQGECFRDGTLRGMPDELCRARLTGPMTVSFDRDAERLVVSVSRTGNDLPQCVDSRPLSARSLGRQDRTGLLAAVIRRSIQRVGKRCGFGKSEPALSLRDLNAVLRETDGLTHIP